MGGNMKAIYTCVFDQDIQIKPAPNFHGWDTILITDRVITDSKGWKVIEIDSWDDPLSAHLAWKLRSHIYLIQYDMVCFIEPHIEILQAPPTGDCFFMQIVSLFSRAKNLMAQYPDQKTVIDRQMNYYSMSKIKLNEMIVNTDFFVRTHTEEMNKFFDHWFIQLEMFSKHEELCFNYLATTNYVSSIVALPYNYNSYFKADVSSKVAKKFKKAPVAVHHITPGRADKNIGKAINDIVKHLPDEDWICLRDIDCFPMYHEEFFKQCEEIANEGKYDLIGCMTNRLGLEKQLYKGQISENTDINYHRQIALELHEKNGNKIIPTNDMIAGLMMLFPKRLWKEVNGFEEGYIVHPNGRYFDDMFSSKIKYKGFKMGIATGIYLFHFYRLGKENPSNYRNHLF
jgi:hypothetical protein